MRRHRTNGTTTSAPEDKNDLGFGSRLSQQEHRRMMNRDGTFNVERDGMSVVRSMSMYQWLITIGWGKFLLLMAAFYIVVNFLFAGGYFLCGPEALNGWETTTLADRFWNCFFFSVETFGTIGYGALSPRSLSANWLMTFEAFFGLVSAAMATGLLFARFARPSACILYSNHAIVAPFRGGKALMVRVINQRSNQLINLEAQIIFSMMEEKEGRRLRTYHGLKLDRERVTFFPLHWVIVHVIDEHSPLHALTKESLKEADVEMFVLISATDETYSQTVHSRSSYRYDEFVWGAKFRDMFIKGNGGTTVGVNINSIHEYDHVPIE